VRDLIVTENITLDGVIDATAGWFAPAGDEGEGDPSDVEAVVREHSAAADALVLGRVTFEEFRGYWPQQADDETGITDYLNEVEKYVFSSTLTDPRWEHTTVLRGPVGEEIERLKSMPGKDIVSTGSMSLVSDLIAGGLVDEYRLFVYPVVLGSGRRLFEHAGEMQRLELVESRAFRSGIVLLRYRAP
jgi:dihydrofolate reductase